MKKVLVLFICFMISFTAGFVYAKNPLRIFVGDKEVENNGEYKIKDDKVYVSEDALKRDLDFKVSYDKVQNKLELYDTKRIELENRDKSFNEFLDYYDPKTADEVAELWARGIKEKNEVFQFAVLSKSLKEKFKVSTEDGGDLSNDSSNTLVKSYNITKEKLNDVTWRFKIDFNTDSSEKNIHTWNAILIVSKENEKWRIVNIQKS